MSNVMSLNAELLYELSCIADDEHYLKKALKSIKKLVAQKREEESPSVVAEDAEEYRPLTKAEVMEELREAFKEAKLIKEGKVKGLTWEEVRDEL